MAVYFIQNTNTLAIKIGVSSNVKSRLRQFRTTTPDDLILLGTIEGDQRTEREIHVRFSHCRVKREWFSPEDELIEYIAEALRNRGGGKPRTVSYEPKSRNQ